MSKPRKPRAKPNYTGKDVSTENEGSEWTRNIRSVVDRSKLDEWVQFQTIEAKAAFAVTLIRRGGIMTQGFFKTTMEVLDFVREHEIYKDSKLVKRDPPFETFEEFLKASLSEYDIVYPGWLSIYENWCEKTGKQGIQECFADVPNHLLEFQSRLKTAKPESVEEMNEIIRSEDLTTYIDFSQLPREAVSNPQLGKHNARFNTYKDRLDRLLQIAVMPDERENRQYERDENGRIINTTDSSQTEKNRFSGDNRRQMAILRTPPDIQEIYLKDEISKTQVVQLGVYVPDPKVKTYEQAIAKKQEADNIIEEIRQLIDRNPSMSKTKKKTEIKEIFDRVKTKRTARIEINLDSPQSAIVRAAQRYCSKEQIQDLISRLSEDL